MKAKVLVLVLLLSVIAIAGCNLAAENGSLAVLNNSENDNIAVTEVYVREKESSGYTLVWTGNLKNQSTEFILLEPGSYSVKIAVTDTGILLSKKWYCETGYNIYGKLHSNGFVNVTFDGDGIFFD